MPVLKIKFKIRPRLHEEVKQSLENGEVLITDGDEALYLLSEIINRREAIVARKDNLNFRVLLENVESIETEGHYLRLYADGDSYMIRKSVTEMLEMLPHSFMRISSSTIVNVSRIAHIGVIMGMRYRLTMKSGKYQYVSRSYYSIFKETFGF